MKTVQEVLSLSHNYLKGKGIHNARRQAEELLSDALNMTRLQIYMDFDRPLTEDEMDRCRDRLSRRSKGEPLQYIRGEVEFHGCSIKVTPAVLIPRQETELLVAMIVKALEGKDLSQKILWDVCCGSGYIGIALKKYFPDLQVFLSDISPEALAIARENAERNGVAVTCLEGDLLKPFGDQKADFVVCNPPYVTEGEYPRLDKEVRDYEPRLALVAGPTGVEFYQRLAHDLKGRLAVDGKLWLEIGTGQGNTIKQIFENAGWENGQVEKDWGGHDRFFFC
jgi:release factor glutamine methyltransferase